jgi:glutathione synthase/RimK-type ligase-like ATP-grasp enzyme
LIKSSFKKGYPDMKLILANNQSTPFRDFYAFLRAISSEPFDYTSYSSLLFSFDTNTERHAMIRNLEHHRDLSDYDGLYINNYLNTYELAAATAIVCNAYGIGFANRELTNPPSLSKLTMYAKLAVAGISIPSTIAGTKAALLTAAQHMANMRFPAVLKRADADRGIDNFKVTGPDHVRALLADHDQKSLWLLQDYIPNDGFYLLNFYGDTLAFCIFRSLEERTDGNLQKAHMYKPQGGANAHLVVSANIPSIVEETARSALRAMNRQIGSVDCLYDVASGKVHVLEVNYNPQLVTINTFKELRKDAFIKYLPKLGQD